MQLAVIVAIVIAIASVTFAMQNSVPATVVFLIWRFDGSLAMIVLLALALGAVIVGLVSTPATLRSKWAIKRQCKEIESLSAANAELRARAANLERQAALGRGGPVQAEETNPGGPVGLRAIAAQFGTSGRREEPKG